MGDPVVVMVVLVNLDERIIDFELVESLRESAWGIEHYNLTVIRRLNDGQVFLAIE